MMLCYEVSLQQKSMLTFVAKKLYDVISFSMDQIVLKVSGEMLFFVFYFLISEWL